MKKLTVTILGVKRGFRGAWAVEFQVCRDNAVVADCDSAAVFDTEQQAKAGAERAVKQFNETGVFPNMCEVF